LERLKHPVTRFENDLNDGRRRMQEEKSFWNKRKNFIARKLAGRKKRRERERER
jgi:hypothetical protein